MEYLYGIPKKKKNKAKKIAIVNCVLILTVVAFFFGYTYTIEKFKQEENTQEVLQNVTQNSEKGQVEYSVTGGESVINPDSQLDIIYNYSCGHSMEKIEPVSPQFSGKSKKQIEAVHSNCIVESISPEISVMSIYLEEICNNHYIIKLEGDYIKVSNKNSADKIEKKIKIDRTMLYEADIEILEDGVEVASMDELLEFLENFSS